MQRNNLDPNAGTEYEFPDYVPPEAEKEEEEKPKARWFIPASELWDMDELGDDIDYIVEESVIRGGLTLVAGKAETGKSFIIQDMAIASVLEQIWMGVKTKPARWAYIDYEMQGSMMKKRLKELALGRGFDRATMKEMIDRLHFINYENLPEIDLLNEESIDELIENLSGYDVLIFDSWAKFMARGDENNATDSTGALDMLRRIRHATGAAIIVLCHENKNHLAYGADKIRGSTALVAEPDIIFRTYRSTGGQLVLKHEKHRALADAQKWKVNFGIEQRGAHLTIAHELALSNEEAKAERQDDLKSRVLCFIRDDAMEEMNRSYIAANVRGSNDAISKALKELADEGQISIRKGEKNASFYTAKAF